MQNYRQRSSLRGVLFAKRRWRQSKSHHERLCGFHSQIYKKSVSCSVISCCISFSAIVQIRCSFLFQRFDAPEGLISLLRCFVLKPGETPDEGWARLYKRLWPLLWVSRQFHHLCAACSVFENDTVCQALVLWMKGFIAQGSGRPWTMTDYLHDSDMFQFLMLRKVVFSILMLFYSVLPIQESPFV